jgi:hypothetical protein
MYEHPRGEINKKFFPIGFIVCALLLVPAPLAGAAPNSSGSSQTPSTEQSKEKNDQNVDSTPTLEKKRSAKAESSVTPSKTPKVYKAGTEKRDVPQSKISQKPTGSAKPVGKKITDSEKGGTGKSKSESKENPRTVKDAKREKNSKEKKILKPVEKRPEKIMATATSEPVKSTEEPSPTPDVSLSPSPKPTGLSAEIEKSDGNNATLVVSGVKEGTKVKVVITDKDAKKK